jgi:hypothetical protein
VTILIALLVFVLPVQAQTPVATVLDSVAWDYTDAAIAAGGVTRFELCLDSSPCVSKTLAEAKHASGPIVYAYKLPALLPGSHTLTIKACNPDLCSAPLAITFRFAVTPDPVTNTRLIKG